jgi:hypothetical protein
MGYYSYQYSLRSAPAVMMPQLSEVFGLLLGVAIAILLNLFLKETGPAIR